ncbi:hypothetical protein CAC42_6026 [Sphaceloma murrayae]|uniref:Uncharacterized protein n=1 Tax=Sphaceloma murrayae TaxID=2082308 RepID=A0A2K1QV57_9PEZI|nr:hypothetical protein CAC42_6026 [Sphaceloma murrayae]
MVVSRPAIARGLNAARLARPVPSSVLRRSLRPAFRRGYASGGGAHAASSDIPWLLGAIAVTVPGCYLLWPEPSHGDAHHGHGEHHEESHDAEPEEKEESEAAPESTEEEAPAETKDEAKADSTKEVKDDTPAEDAKDSGDETEAKPAESAGEAEKTSNKKVDGVQFKGKTSAGDENNEMHDTRKREPDGKGGFKKRIDSAYQKDLGAGDHVDEDGNHSGKTAVKPSGNPGAIDSKQAGLSTTATRHSTQIDQDPEKSKKGEGVPETAKSATTIDPKRPQGSSPDEKTK